MIQEPLNALVEKFKERELSRREAIRESLRTPDNMNVDTIIANHSLSKSELANRLGITRPTLDKAIAELIEENQIDEPIRKSNQYLFTLDHAHNLAEKVDIPKWSDRYKHTHIHTVHNQKGGTGKSTTAISVATALALPVRDRMRVLLIDLDPQGSQAAFTLPDVNETSDILTSVDLIMGEFEGTDTLYGRARANGYSHEELVKLSCQPTAIPNLDIIPAFPVDERFNEFYFKSNLSSHCELLLKKVIEPVKDHYDAIFIDTAPASNPLVWSALEASNGIIIPVSPKKLDWLSTGACLEELSYRLGELPSKGERIDWFKICITNMDDEQGRDEAMVDDIREDAGIDVLKRTIKKSSAFEAASRNYRTVLDLRKKDALCPARQLDKAVTSIKDVANEIREIMIEQEHKKG